MMDIKFIRQDTEAFDEAMKRRGVEFNSVFILETDEHCRKRATALQELEANRNKLAKEIAETKVRGGDTAELEDDAKRLRWIFEKTKSALADYKFLLKNALESVPNIPDPEVLQGKDSQDNLLIKFWGKQTKFTFDAKEHWDLGLLDFERARHLSGARFVVLQADVARLSRALGNFMLDLHTNAHGYSEVAPPLMVREEIIYGTGQLPKMEDDLFKTEDDRWLIPTAEVPLTALFSGEILERENLPIRMVALTPCFRAEAGASGKDTRGMIRQHQFDKVELVSLTLPEDSDDELIRMRTSAEKVLRELELPYRVADLCTGELGFSAARTFDLEVWLPGQGRYREISSCSNCRDFQSRRLGLRFRERGKEGTRLAHTLNGSGVAVGRALIAVIENYQQADGSIVIPKVLQPYMGGEKVLRTSSII